MPIERKNVIKSYESFAFAKEMKAVFDLTYGEDYTLDIHIIKVKGMVSKIKQPWILAYQLPNAIRVDNGDVSGGFITFEKTIEEDVFMDVLKFVTKYLNTRYEKYL